MDNRRNVFLVGPMGAGKSTVGRILADELSLTFIDSDREIEERCGADIAWIFDMEGEAGFRKREAEVLDDLTARTGVLVATGGGAVMDPDTRKRLISRGTVIYLETPMEQQVERTKKDRRRPLLQQARSPEVVLQELQIEREPLYRETADLVFRADKRSARMLATEIARHVLGD